jgi:hypothetical protein
LSVNKHPTFADALWELVSDSELICRIQSKAQREIRRRLIQKEMTYKNGYKVHDGNLNKKTGSLASEMNEDSLQPQRWASEIILLTLFYL